MARVEIELPSEFTFTANIPIRIGDINRGNHLGHAEMISLLEEARTQFFTSRGFAESKNTEVNYIIADLAIIYKKQVRYGQLLKIQIAAVNFTGKSFELLYLATDSREGTEIARAKTGILLFDYRTQKIAPITPDFINKLSG
jgi:acyl-CoA thioester hydrolase